MLSDVCHWQYLEAADFASWSLIRQCILCCTYNCEVLYFPVNKPNRQISRDQFLALKMMVLCLLFIIILLIDQ